MLWQVSGVKSPGRGTFDSLAHLRTTLRINQSRGGLMTENAGVMLLSV